MLLSLFPSNYQREFSRAVYGSNVLLHFTLCFLYPLTYPFTFLYFHLPTQVKNSLRVVNKGRAEQQKGKIWLNLQVPLPSQYILLCFYRFYWCFFFFRKCSICILSREYHLSLLTQMIRKYLVMFAVSLIVPLDIHSMLWSQKM